MSFEDEYNKLMRNNQYFETLKNALNNELREKIIDAVLEEVYKDVKENLEPLLREELTKYTFNSIEQVREVLTFTDEMRVLIKYNDENEVRRND